MSGTQTRQNSEIVSQRQRGKLGTSRIRTPLSTVGECTAQKAISSLPDRYALAAGE